jgi:hypothetical protein
MTTVAVMEKQGGKDCRIQVPVALIRAALTARSAYQAAIGEIQQVIANGGWKPGYDGAPPEISCEVRPNDNPQMTPARNVREHPLDLMYHRKQIGFRQWSAGDQLRADLELAHVSPIRGTDYDRIFASTVPRLLEKTLETAGGEVLKGPITFRPKTPKRSFAHQPVSDITMAAMNRLIAARGYVVERLSAEHFEIARLMMAERKTLSQIGGNKVLGHRNTAGKRFRMTLDCLADWYVGRRS